MRKNIDKNCEMEMAFELKADCYSSNVARECFNTFKLFNGLLPFNEKKLKHLIYNVYKKGAADAMKIKNFMEE